MDQIKEIQYATDIRKDRRKGKGTNEFFTPSSLVKKMCDKLPEDTWTDFSKTILEPSAGNYNFVIECLKRRLEHCKTQHDCESAFSTLYSVELMTDNVLEGHERLKELIKLYNFNVSEIIEQYLIKNHVCSDFFKWDFDKWEPIIENKCEALF